jgi:TolB-like protein/tetratricopeptide (TPR) repeat protein
MTIPRTVGGDMAETGGEAKTSGGTPAPPDASAGTSVFISYASQDAAVAGALVEALERHGVGCWIAPRDVKAGALYADAIVRAISGAKAIVLVLSESAIASSHVGKEIERASSKKRPIIALRIDAAPLTPALEYFLSESQWVEAQTGSMEAAYAKLIAAIRDPARTAPRHIPAAPLEVSTGAARAAHPKLRFNWILLAVGTVFVVALAALLVDKFWISSHLAQEKPVATTSLAPAAGVPAQPTISEKSVAVLPFTDMSEKKDQEYFADGLSEEILNLLAGIPTLSVIGRTSSFQFKGKNDDLRAIGAKLGAAYVLEGSVRRSGDRVRVTAQLIGTHDGVHRWSNSYNRPFGEVLKLQGELAAGVARALDIIVGSDTLQSHNTSRNPEAYDLYLRGLYVSDRFDKEGFEEAANYYQQALDLDPSFAAAATGLGWIFIFQAEFGFTPVVETYERARRSLETAIRLDPKSGEAHASLGWVHTAYDWDWEAAGAEIKEALRLSQRDPTALMCAARLSEALGHWDEAVRQLNSVIARDPLDPGLKNMLSGMYARAGRLAEAEATERRVLEISPTYASAPYNLGVILLALGRRGEALKAMQQATVDRVKGLVLVYYALGRKADSDAQLAALTREHASDDAVSIAEAHAYRDEVDEAFRWLDRAYAQKDPTLYLVKGDRLLKNLEPDPRYKAFLHKMKLPE